MRRPIQMQPPGNMAGVFKAQRVGSSTCPKPQTSTADGTHGLVDFADGFVNPETLFVAEAVQKGNFSDDVFTYFGIE